MSEAVSISSSYCPAFNPCCSMPVWLEDLVQRVTACVQRIFASIQACFQDFFCDKDSAPVEERLSSEELARRRTAELEAEQCFNERLQEDFVQINRPEGIRLIPGPAHLDLCPGLHLHQAPVIGCYNVNGYMLAISSLKIRLPHNQLRVFPQAIQDHLRNVPEGNREVFFMVFDDRFLCHMGEYSRNLCLHAEAFPDLQEGQAGDFISSMGMFETSGIYPDQRGSIAINSFSQQRIYPHPSINGDMAMSPNNARFAVDPNVPCSSFFCGATLPNNRAAAFFALIVHEGEDLIEAIDQQNSLRNFLQFLERADCRISQREKDTIGELFRFQRIYNPEAPSSSS
ncbi:MAG: hypothetical protein Tsb0015_16920 [Simkaniaceae bacterium]